MQFIGRLAKLWLLLGLVGSSAYFSYFNRERILIALPPWAESVSVPAFAAYLGIFLIGSAVTTVFLGLESFRKSFEIRKLTKRLKELEPESVTLENIAERNLRAPAIDPSST